MKKRSSVLLFAVLAAGLGCQEQTALRFGAVLPLTGEFAIYGEPIRKGIELAFEEVKARPDAPPGLELVVQDSGGDPDKARDLLAELYEGGAYAVLGGVTTAEAMKMVPVADKHGRVLISPSASTPSLTGISENFYRVFPSDSKEGTTMGTFAAVKLKIETVVILAKEDEYARGVQAIFQAEFERAGGDIVEEITYPPGPTDLSGFVERVISIDPAGVYIAAYAEDIGRLIRMLREGGFRGTILTTAAFSAPEVIEQVGASAEGVFLTQAVFEADSEEEPIKSFVEAFRAKHGLTPDLFAAHGYDAFMVLIEAQKASGGMAGDFWQAIRSIRAMPGVTGTIQFDERGDVQKFPRVYVISEGNLIDYEAEIEMRRRELLERLRNLKAEQARKALGGS